MGCRSIHSCVAAAMAALLTGAAHALTYVSCPPPPPQQPRAMPQPAGLSEFPFSTILGKLAYHSYVNRAGDGTGQLHLYDIARQKHLDLPADKWGIRDPMNPAFSPDGRWLTFTGIKDNAWNIFMWEIESARGPHNMTNSTGQTSNQDPKFSADGRSLYFKQGHRVYDARTDNWLTVADVMQGTLSYTSAGPVFTSSVNLTQSAKDGVENSMPFPAPTGATFYFTTGVAETLRIHRMTPAHKGSELFDGSPGISTYYPVVRSDGTVFYTRWLDKASMLDQIYTKAGPSDTPRPLPLNSCSNNSDPWPVNNTDYVFFSSTRDKGYQLFLGNARTGQSWNLSLIGLNADSTRAKLGASYHPGVKGPAPVVTLLSQGRPATASSSYDASMGPSFAFDGNTTRTRWDSIEGNNVGIQWLMVDLGSIRTITGVELYWDAGAKVYEIQASDDAKTWTTLRSVTDGVSYTRVSHTLSGRGRYVRMYGTQRATEWGYSLWEMQVFGY